MLKRWIAGVALAAACTTAAAQAVAYPTKPITIIVPYATGSGSDIQARLFGQHLSTALSVPVVVENRPGANGAVGLQALKAAPADGHTLALGGGSVMVINPLLTKNLGYDPTDFVCVSVVAKSCVGSVVGAASPHRPLDTAILVVRDLAEYDGKPALACGPKDVHCQFHIVAHGDHLIAKFDQLMFLGRVLARIGLPRVD